MPCRQVHHRPIAGGSFRDAGCFRVRSLLHPVGTNQHIPCDAQLAATATQSFVKATHTATAPDTEVGRPMHPWQHRTSHKCRHQNCTCQSAVSKRKHQRSDPVFQHTTTAASATQPPQQSLRTCQACCHPCSSHPVTMMQLPLHHSLRRPNHRKHIRRNSARLHAQGAAWCARGRPCAALCFVATHAQSHQGPCPTSIAMAQGPRRLRKAARWRHNREECA